MELIYNPWPWYIAGPIIALIMVLLIVFGKSFGMSSNLRTICAIAGAGKYSDFFRFEWKNQIWNLVLVLGAVIGGFIAHNYMTNDYTINLNQTTIKSLNEIGIKNPGSSYLPDELFGIEALNSLYGWIYLIFGGILIGFGTRYAGGCTSGHAISGLSNMQLPSLIAVIGFFIGGLLMNHFILPFLL
jgi:uncharacterized membrane protein YedE/YeeE|tara:strand:+ start:2448 stop:3005 length:558 start_codon:yes stop_codon:yes gene_type:complete